MKTKSLKLRRETLRTLIPTQMATVAGGRYAGFLAPAAEENEAPITTTYQSTVVTIGLPEIPEVADSTAGPSLHCQTADCHTRGCNR